MWLMYLIAFIPIIIGFFVWVYSKEINFLEYLLSCVIGFLVVIIIHGLVILGMTGDTETWSGYVTKAIHIPQWVEEYQQSHTYYVGKTSHTYYTTEHRTHYPEWSVECTLGERGASFRIDEAKYKEILSKFGEEKTVYGSRDGFDSGDHNDYIAVNTNNYIVPITQEYSFSNKVKACPSVFSYEKIPKTIKVYEYPQNGNPFVSNRLLGVPKKDMNIFEFDKMNTFIGMKKYANVILINFEGKDRKIAQYQEAKWVGGKKNDIVICYSKNPKWSYVFGWTEKEVVKRDLEEMFINNDISTNMTTLIQEEIMNNYVIKDWKKFDYLTVDTPGWAYFLLIIIMIIAQATYYYYASANEYKKED